MKPGEGYDWEATARKHNPTGRANGQDQNLSEDTFRSQGPVPNGPQLLVRQ